MQDINKSFGGVIDLCVCDFCEFFSDIFEHSEGIFQYFTFKIQWLLPRVCQWCDLWTYKLGDLGSS